MGDQVTYGSDGDIQSLIAENIEHGHSHHAAHIIALETVVSELREKINDVKELLK